MGTSRGEESKTWITLTLCNRDEADRAIERLANGLLKLKETGEAVTKIEEDLKVRAYPFAAPIGREVSGSCPLCFGCLALCWERAVQIKLDEAEKKRTVAEGIAETVAREKAIVEVETEKARVESEEVAKIQAEVAVKQKDTEADLAKAEPAVVEAMKVRRGCHRGPSDLLGWHITSLTPTHSLPRPSTR